MSDPWELKLSGSNEEKPVFAVYPDRTDHAKCSGVELIAHFVKNLPHRPGVYRMYDDKGEVLYVGKARDLKSRVGHYTRLEGQPARIATMIAATIHMEFVTTETEAQALLLEANLIKKYRPRYNVLLRDDKSYPYILIAKDHSIAELTRHRGGRGRKGSYYGPFASSSAVNQAINTLQRAFLLRSCSQSFFNNRTRPCLLYQIKRCSAPCVGYIAENDYNNLVAEAENFLSGKSTAIKSDLACAMEEAATRLDYEQAARLRDRLQALSYVTNSQRGIHSQGIAEADVFGFAQQGDQSCIQLFFFRAYQNWGNRSFFPRADKAISSDDLLSSFIAQFYDDKPIPALILSSHEIADRQLLQEALSLRALKRIEIIVPQRGEKKYLSEQAQYNAREALGRKLAESSSQLRLLAALVTVFDLKTLPERIEIYDNSHIQGVHAIGVMVVAGAEGFMRSHYRKFNIRSANLSGGDGVTASGGDDIAMMREVFTRRFKHLHQEIKDKIDEKAQKTEESLSSKPDLIFIDGGRGQLNTAHQALKDLKVDDIVLIAVSKGPDRHAGREQFHMLNRPSFGLELRDPVLYFVQRLRDEAHRFAVGGHRAQRSKALHNNSLDEISGVGKMRRRALLQAFGSAKAVAQASISDLSSVSGVNIALAKIIYDHFHGGTA